MARELIYKDEARKAVLKTSPANTWCIDNIKPVLTVDTEATPQVDELWRARIQYWPGQIPVETIVQIYYIWHNGDIAFVPILTGSTNEQILSSQCASFELIGKLGE